MVLKRAVDQPNSGPSDVELTSVGRVAVHRAAGKVFQMTGPATAKLLIPSMVLVLGTDSIPVQADRRCRLPAMADSRPPSTLAPIRVGTCKLSSPACT